MKKTVSIQISGMLFHVDDDAYIRLDEYLESIRSHFATLADRDEIVSDIESRIAETFSEKLKKSKQTVTLKDVDALIAKMGTVEDFEAFEADTDETPKKKTTDSAQKNPPRRFYRNPDDKVIAGVASGIAAYFGIDPVIVRVIFVICGFFNGLGVIAYIVLWIAMPLAKTHTERMELQGEPTTLTGLEKKIRRSTQSYATEKFTSVYARGGLRLFIREGKEWTVSARGSAQGLKATDVHVVNGQLRIDPFQGSWTSWIFHGFQRLSFDITLPDLQAVDVNGGCSVDIDGFKGKEISLKAVGASALRASLQATVLRIQVGGASSATITGSADTIHATVSGASSLNARAFKTANAHTDISGASSADLQATDTVDGQATGGSSVCIYGSPVVTAKASGTSSVTNKDGKAEEAPQWQKEDIKVDQNMYTYHSPISRFFRMIWKSIKVIIQTILRVIGGIITTVTAIALMFLIMTVIRIIQTGYVPYLNIGPILDHSPLAYLYLAVACVIVFVPIIFLFQIGTSLIELKRRFTIAGAISLFVIWLVVIASAVFAGGILFPDWRHVDNGPVATQTFGATDFTAIHAKNSDVLHIRQGTGFSITARGPHDDLQTIHLLKQKETLVIEHVDSRAFCLFCDPQRVEFDITVPRLTALTAGGLTRATVTGFTGSTFTLTTADLSHVSIEGKTGLLTLESNDLSHVDGLKLESQRASVILHDLSHAEILVHQEIKGETHDMSKLYYTGHAAADIRSHDLSGISSDSYYDEYDQGVEDDTDDFPEEWENR